MLGLRNRNNNRISKRTLTNAAGSRLVSKLLPAKHNANSFITKRKRSLDTQMSEAQPRKQRKTSLEMKSVSKSQPLTNTQAQQAPSSFLQPLPPFECRSKAAKPTVLGRQLVFRGLKKTVFLSKAGKVPETDDRQPENFMIKAKSELGNLTQRIRRLEEKNVYWRRKSGILERENVKLRQEMDRMVLAANNMESERLKLQEKFMRAEADGKACTEEIRKMLSENRDLKAAVSELNEELGMMSTVDGKGSAAVNVDMRDVSPEHVGQIEQALADTLADLTDKIEEIELLKTELARLSIHNAQLEDVVTRETLLSQIMRNDDQKDPEHEHENATKMARLQEAVEKCMFRIALLSEKNEQYRIVIRSAREANRPPLAPEMHDLLGTLQSKQKVQILESLCMQKYRQLLRDTAEGIVANELNCSMDESFTFC